jgi:hypothetical protein
MKKLNQIQHETVIPTTMEIYFKDKGVSICRSSDEALLFPSDTTALSCLLQHVFGSACTKSKSVPMEVMYMCH